ncbi:hypothetical protein AMTRI_Chr06g194400 [Amborella trichopoda]
MGSPCFLLAPFILGIHLYFLPRFLLPLIYIYQYPPSLSQLLGPSNGDATERGFQILSRLQWRTERKNEKMKRMG